MVKIHQIHKFAGLSGGILLLLLAFTGFFLDHENWKFLYTTTFKTTSQNLLKKDNRLLESYYVDKSNSEHIVVTTLRGIYESNDAGKTFHKTLDEIATSIKTTDKETYASTSNGIYILTEDGWQSFTLQGKHLTSFSIHNNIAFVAQEKKYLYVIDLSSKEILSKTTVSMDKQQLKNDIRLSRFVRDLHYGRGLFDDGVSLLFNDYAAIVMVFLSLSGYLIWYLIKNKKSAKTSRKLIRFHANIFVVFASFFMLILAVTGMFLDHSSALARFMSSVTIPHQVLPPVYTSLKEDIWSVDYDGKVYRIGNRYGIYKSKDLKEWKLENKGFAYRMIRKDDVLYISGMGASNRLSHNDKYEVLPRTPHMFKDVISENDVVEYISIMSTKRLLPKYTDITLFSIILAIHDGSFFSEWWIWINDVAAILLIILALSGFYRWYYKKYVQNKNYKL